MPHFFNVDYCSCLFLLPPRLSIVLVVFRLATYLNSQQLYIYFLVLNNLNGGRNKDLANLNYVMKILLIQHKT
jgi:hypothetical protein